MKKLMSIGLVLIFSAFMFSCGGGSSDNPADVAKDFLTALAEQDYDAAKDLGTVETVQLIGINGLRTDSQLISQQNSDNDE